MKIEASSIDDYLSQVPAERQACLTQLRELCRKTLTGFDESLMYGMPAYARNGVAEVAFASQKQYISLYVMKVEVVERYREALAPCSIGNCCIRFKKPGHLKFEVIEQLLKDSVTAASAAAC